MVNENYSDKNIKQYIVSRIELAGKEVVMYNKLLSKIKGFKGFITYYKDMCEDGDSKNIKPELIMTLLKLEEDIKNKKQIKEKYLSNLLYGITVSEEFRKILGINGIIKSDKYDLYIDDILESMELLTFNNSKEISNFILAYMQKFI